MIYTIDCPIKEEGKINIEPIHPFFLGSTDYREWINDVEINEYSSLCRFPNTEKSIKSLFVDMENGKAIHWIIYHVYPTLDKYPIGTVSLQEIDLFNKSAELAIKIGKKDHWNKGFGYKICKMVLSHGFNRLNLNNIYLGTVSDNKAMKKLAEKLKMKYEGTLRKVFHSNNKFYNVNRYSILYSEYKAEN